MKIQLYLNRQKEIVEKLADLFEFKYKTIQTKDKNGMFCYEMEIDIPERLVESFNKLGGYAFMIDNAIKPIF